MVVLKNRLPGWQLSSLQERKKIEPSQATLPSPQGRLGRGKPIPQRADNASASDTNANGTALQTL